MRRLLLLALFAGFAGCGVPDHVGAAPPPPDLAPATGRVHFHMAGVR